MPIANPFFVDPTMGRTGNELSGLANVIQENRDKQAAIEQSEKAKSAVIAAIQSNDPSQVAEASVNFPEYSDIIANQIGAVDATKKKSAADFIRSILTASPDQRAALYEQRINSVEDPTQSSQSYQDWLQDPEGEMREMEMVYAGLDPDGYKVIRDKKTDELKEREFALTSQNVYSQIGARTAATNLASKQFTQKIAKAEAKAAEGVQIDHKGRLAINKDVTGLIKDTKASIDAAVSLEALQKNGSPAAQLAGIFKFMKSLDPTSVVREGEQNMARSTGGPMDKFVGMINNAVGEGGLTPRAFKDMVRAAKTISNSGLDSAITNVGTYLGTYEDTLPESFKTKLQERLPTAFDMSEYTVQLEEGSTQIPREDTAIQAPQSALNYLINNPDKAQDFKKKYGYLPEGFE